jgi:uncharacterized membrane protein (UPF0136 family)
MIHKLVAWTVLIYGVLLMGFGYLGYAHSGSLVSLYMGLGSGILLILCALAIFARNGLGVYLSIILSLFLTAIFTYRYTVTQKTNPALLAVISGAMLLFLLATASKLKKIK